jgi:hypothetical protein
MDIKMISPLQHYEDSSIKNQHKLTVRLQQQILSLYFKLHKMDHLHDQITIVQYQDNSQVKLLAQALLHSRKNQLKKLN